MTPLYQMLMGGNMAPSVPMQVPQPAPQMSGMRFQNPMQKMNYIMQAMRNPAAFVKQHLPNIPDAIANDPNQILQYMQQNMGVTQMDIQNAQAQIPIY